MTGRLTVLIDDTRSFADGRLCLVARSSAQARQLLWSLRGVRINDVWLDHDLGEDDDIWPVIRLLEDAWLRGRPYDIGLVHVQARGSGPAHRIGISLRRLGYTVERSFDLRMWGRWDGRPENDLDLSLAATPGAKA